MAALEYDRLLSSIRRPNRILRYLIPAVFITWLFLSYGLPGAGTVSGRAPAPDVPSSKLSPDVSPPASLEASSPPPDLKTSLLSETLAKSDTAPKPLAPPVLEARPASDALSTKLGVAQPSDEFALDGLIIHSRIAKVTAVFYDEVSPSTEAYELALTSHLAHDRTFGYRHFVQRRGLNGTWGKLAYLLSILIAEMEKPPDMRLDWLFWHDADLVLVNSQIPLDIFLPPDGWSHVNFICANDLAGLNNGVFFLRVCDWSVQYMAAAMSYKTYFPDVFLRYDEQTTMMLLARENERFTAASMHVPQRWFNAYHHFGTDSTIPPEWNWTNGYIEPGDLLVHLPGTGDSRKDLIKEWLAKIRDEPKTWILPLDQTSYVKEIEHFWAQNAQHEVENEDDFWRRLHVIEDVGGTADDWRRKAVEDIEERLQSGNLTMEEKTEAVEAVDAQHAKDKMAALRAEYAARLDGTKKDNIHAEQ